MSRIFFTSDEHYGHANIIQYCDRPFGSVDHMTEELVRRHNSVVGDHDLVYHVGDFAMSPKYLESVGPRLNGSHALIPGNHDKCHPMHKCGADMLARYAAVFGDVSRWYMDIEGFDVCHIPYVEDRTEGKPRFPDWRVPDNGRWLLHGHVHEKWKIKAKQINVGVDQWHYYPVSLDELKSLRAANDGMIM